MTSSLTLPSYQNLEDWWYKSHNAWNRVVRLIFFKGPECDDLTNDFSFKPKNKETFLADYRFFFDALNNRDLEHNYKIAACAKLFSTFMEMTDYPEHFHLTEPRRLSREEVQRRMAEKLNVDPGSQATAEAEAHEDAKMDELFKKRLDERNRDALRQHMLDRLRRGESVEQP